MKSKIVAGVCGLANQLGGYFMVGAEEDKDAGTWTLPGIENDCREDTHDWLARILSGNLVDAPPFEIRSWKLKDDRVAAVIRVDQTAIPPCMTKDGLVYVRVVSETVKVKDPRMLADLLRKGEAARKDAEDKAVATLSLMIEGGALAGEEIDRFVLALAPTTVGIDYTVGSSQAASRKASWWLPRSLSNPLSTSVEIPLWRCIATATAYCVAPITSSRGSGYFTRCGTAWWRLSLLAPAQVEVLLRSTRSWLKLGGPPRPHCRL